MKCDCKTVFSIELILEITSCRIILNMDHVKFISMNYIKVVEKHALYFKTECCSKHYYNTLETPPMLVKSIQKWVLKNACV